MAGTNWIPKEFYTRLRSSGKPAKVALVAVMRKLLVTLNVMVREGNTWREPTLAKEKTKTADDTVCPWGKGKSSQ